MNIDDGYMRRLRPEEPLRDREVAVPEDMEEQEHRVHDNLVEGIVVADDDMLERYLEGDVPSVEELTEAIGTMLEKLGKSDERYDGLWVNPDCGLKTRGVAEMMGGGRRRDAGARDEAP